jgi:tape measure domain-containing protein
MAGAINLANVALGFDSSKITRGVDASAGEIRRLNQIFKDSIAPVDRYNADLAILEKGYKAGAISADRMKQAVASLQEKYKQGPAAVGGGVLGGDLKNTLAQYAGAAAAFQGIKTSISLAATAESNRISLEVLTGSVEKAESLFQGFRQLDRESPLSRQDFSKAAQTLVGYGFAADSTLPALKQLSEISVGNADRFQSLSLAFGQVTAQGRLMGQEVLQMVNAGFNPLQEISRTTGRSMIELKKAMEDGAISSSMVEDALKSATSEGGRFYDMNERLKNSAAGQFAKMKSDVELLATEIGTNLLPTAKAFMDLMNAGSTNGGQGFLAQSASAFSTTIAAMQDAFTNLDGNSQGTALATDEKRRIDMSVQAELQQRNSSKFYKEQADQINKILAERARKERDDIAAAAKLKIDEEKKAIEELADMEEQSTRRVKAIEKLEKERELEGEFKRREAQILTDAAMKRDKMRREGEGGVTENSAPGLRAGSVEAYKFLLGQKDKLAEQGEKQLKVQEDILTTMNEQLNELKSSSKFTKVR